MLAPKICSIEGCGRHAPNQAKPPWEGRWCKMHITRWERHGSPFIVKHYREHPGQGKRTPNAQCRVPDCTDTVDHGGRGFCSKHYTRLLTHGDPLYEPPILPTRICSVDECNDEVRCREWCWKHYKQWYDWGDPLKPRSDLCPICQMRNKRSDAPACSVCRAHAAPLGERNQDQKSRQDWTLEEIIIAYQADAADRGHHASAKEWTEDHRPPHATTIIYRFGSWNAMVEAAGFTPRQPGHPTKDERITGRPGELPPHGTVARYVHKRKPCRCDLCKAANTAKKRAYVDQARQNPSNLPLPPHGTLARYRHNTEPCRCNRCRKAAREYMRDYRKRKRQGT